MATRVDGSILVVIVLEKEDHLDQRLKHMCACTYCSTKRDQISDGIAVHDRLWLKQQWHPAGALLANRAPSMIADHTYHVGAPSGVGLGVMPRKLAVEMTS